MKKNELPERDICSEYLTPELLKAGGDLHTQIAERCRIVAKADTLIAFCDRLEAALTDADTTRTRLLETLLNEALEPSLGKQVAAE